MTHQGDITSQQPGTSQPADLAGVDPAGITSPAAAQPAGPGTPGSGPAADQPAIFWPSPYLAEGQSVPEAYPAPARPGQPKYGVAPAPAQPARYGRPAYGRRSVRQRPFGGQGQPGTGQAGPGPAGTAQAGLAQAARSPAHGDVSLASAWERLLAMTMDWILILGASFLLLHAQMTQLLHRFQSVLIASQTLSQDGARTALTNFDKAPATVSALLSYFLMAFLIALVYFWALQATGGATLGKRVLRLRVVNAADKSPAGVRAAGVRTILFLIGPAVCTFAPSIGFLGAGIVSLAGVAIWLADSLVLASDPHRQSLHDKLAGTMVIRKPPASSVS